MVKQSVVLDIPLAGLGSDLGWAQPTARLYQSTALRASARHTFDRQAALGLQ